MEERTNTDEIIDVILNNFYSDIRNGTNSSNTGGGGSLYTILIDGFTNVLQNEQDRILNDLENTIIEFVSQQSLNESTTEHNNNTDVEPLDLPFNIYKDVEEKFNTSCSICLEDFEDESKVVVLSCKHIYHKKCIKEWTKIKRNCPLCKVSIV